MEEDNTFLPKCDDPMLIFKIRRSSWFLIGPMIALGCAAILLVAAVLIFAETPGIFEVLFSLMIVVSFALGGFVIWADWVNSYYILTDHTVEQSTGFITKNKTYLSLHDLCKMECDKGVIGSIFNFGTIIIEGEIAAKPFKMVGVPSPHRVMDLIRQARAHVAA